MPNFTNRFIEGGTVGTYKDAGLPNITGDIVSNVRYGFIQISSAGAFVKGTSVTGGLSGINSSNSNTIGFDASQSNSIYGNSTTVQPPALCMNIVIKY